MLAFAITALVVLVAAAIALAWAWTVKAPVRMAFIRTSVGGRGGDGDEGPVGRVISSFLTALGGTFYAQYFAYIDPTVTFGPAVSIQALLQAIVGGAGTVLGPFLGAFVLTPVSELTRAAIRGRAGVDIMAYGLVLILVISFLPHGLMGWFKRGRRAAAETPA